MRAFLGIMLVGVIVPFMAGCGSKLASTGFARVTDVSPQGAIRMQYGSGESSWKKVDESNVRKDTLVAMKNRYRPAKYVETKNGSTLTFSDGDTIVYQDLN